MEETDLSAQLPDDVLVGVLRRPAPRGIAVSRCVCKAWRSLIDSHQQLRARLLPSSLAGILINFHGYHITELFSRPSTDPRISGKRRYLPESSAGWRDSSWSSVQDHCNGLLLLHHDDYVLNPATGWRWEQRSFSRQGEAAGTVDDMRSYYCHEEGCNAVYWQGALYIHCQTDFIMRISLANSIYKVIKLPAGTGVDCYPQFCLGKSEKGVYCASVEGRSRIQVWILKESSCNKTEWVLKHDRDLVEWLLKHYLEYPVPNPNDPKVCGPWTLQDINDYYFPYNGCEYMESEASTDEEFSSCPETNEDRDNNKDDNVTTLREDEFEWRSEASDEETFAWTSDNEGTRGGTMDILRFLDFILTKKSSS